MKRFLAAALILLLTASASYSQGLSGGGGGGGGPAGPAGPTGPAGAAVLNGTGAPSGGTGNNNDFYLDTVASKIYGPKAAGAWPGSGTVLIGPMGATGATGSTGSAGSTGAAGNSLLNGTTNPTGGVGNNGDFYLNTATSAVWGPKAAGAWPGSGTSLIGATGSTGAAGNTVLNGSGVPGSGLGNNGDYYINNSTAAIFGPKAAGSWPGTGTALVGPTGLTGTNGNTLLNGTGAPGSGVGVTGDFYLDTAATKMYGPKAGAWPGSGTSLIGATGATGSPGATGSSGSPGNTVLNGASNPTSGQGNNGDYFINNTTSTIFGPKAAGAWPGSGTVLIGATGSAGAAGNTIRNGTGAPGSGVGVNGDYYLDNATTILYGPKAAGAWPGSGTSLIGSGAGLTTANAWTNTNRTPSCALTDAASISVPAGCNVRTVTLGGNRTLASPTLFGGEWLNFLITQDATGSRLLNYGLAYVFSNNAKPTLTTTPGATDEIDCYALSATELKCPGFSPDVTALPVLVSHASNSNAGAGTSLAVSLTGYSGSPLIIGTMSCADASCSAAPTTQVVTGITASGGNTCSHVSASRATGIFATDIWVCGTGTAGTNTITLTGGAGTFYLQGHVSEWGRITGACEVANQTTPAAATSFSLATNGSTTVLNSVIFAEFNAGGGGAPPVAGNTAIDATGAALSEYQLGRPLGTYTNSATTSVSAVSAMSIAACH